MRKFVITVAFIIPASTAAQGASPFDRVPEIRRESAAGNHLRAVALADSLVAAMPSHPNAVFVRAGVLVLAGQDDAAERDVRRLLRWDARYARFVLRDTTFTRLRARFGDVDVAALAARVDQPIGRGQVWATIAERDLVLEGSAWDPSTRSFLVGSLHKNTVLAVAPDGSVSERVPRGASGLGSVVGIHVDSARGTLWVASVRRFDDPSDTAHAALFAFDARTGAFRRRVDAADPNAFLNDLTTGRDGSVYVTDSRGGGVHRLRPGATTLEPLASLGRTWAPNGITTTPDGSHLFVADMDRILVHEVSSGRTWPLALPDSIAVTGIDGLAFARGSLIAHHPLTFWRIARYEMDASSTRITGMRPMEWNTADSRTATTGEVVGDHYYFIGNGQIDRMNQRTIDAATMQPIRLYRAPLDAPRAFVVVARSAADSATVLDAHSLEVVGAVRTGKGPHEVTAAPDGRRAFVADASDSSVTVVDVGEAPRVAATWRLPRALSVHDVATSSDGTVWAASGTPAVVLELDRATGRVRREHAIARDGSWMIEPGGPNGAMVVTSLEGGAITLLGRDGSRRELVAEPGVIDAAATPDGREIWTVNDRTGTLTIFDVAAGREVHRVEGPSRASRVTFVPGGRTALVVSAGDSSVVAYDVVSRTRTGAVKLASAPKVIAVSRDGRRAYVTHPGANALSMIDISAMALMRRVDVAGHPDGVAVVEPR